MGSLREVEIEREEVEKVSPEGGGGESPVMFQGHEDEEGPEKDAEKKEEIAVSGKPHKESISRRKA